MGWKNVKNYTYTDYKPPAQPAVKGKATYQQIISYVQDHFNLKVSNLDIAQTKDLPEAMIKYEPSTETGTTTIK